MKCGVAILSPLSSVQGRPLRAHSFIRGWFWRLSLQGYLPEE
jgi:hypothetical protein